MRRRAGERALAAEPARHLDLRKDVVLNSRSVLQILQAIGSYVEVREEHVRRGLAVQAFQLEALSQGNVGRIHSGPNRPGAYAAVQYLGQWFWVDGSDWQAKRALTTVVFFFTLKDTGAPELLLLVTIPAQ